MDEGDAYAYEYCDEWCIHMCVNFNSLIKYKNWPSQQKIKNNNVYLSIDKCMKWNFTHSNSQSYES